MIGGIACVHVKGIAIGMLDRAEIEIHHDSNRFLEIDTTVFSSMEGEG